MKTFDYAAAWREVARPAYLALPADVIALVGRVAVEARDLSQAPDCSMRWPEPNGGALREAFAVIDPEALALAARVVYYVGHWWPRHGRGVELPGREHGGHWKFSHYADQVIRERLNLSANPDGGNYPGLSFQVHEGALRLCYQSRDMWTWAEIAPATPAGLLVAQQLRANVSAALPSGDVKMKRANVESDGAAWRAFENLKGNITFPPEWGRLMETDAYMVEEGDQAPDPDLPPVDVEAVKRARIQELRDDCARRVAKLERERDGRIWFVERDVPIDDLILYDHQDGGAGVWEFGWQERRRVGPVLLSRILSVISEFGQGYRIRTADGRTLEGNIG
jgi:hypothetical protein